MRKLRMGMVGGGKNAFIGAIHRIAANMDGLIELHCGAFSSSPETSIASGKEFFLPESKCYGSYPEKFATENSLPKEQRMDFVTIVTPNFAHFAPAKMALENGFDVICDKPVSFSLAEAKKLHPEVPTQLMSLLR